LHGAVLAVPAMQRYEDDVAVFDGAGKVLIDVDLDDVMADVSQRRCNVMARTK
jgi:hypothetical protein